MRAIQTAAGIMDSSESEDMKLRACDLLLQRGWGRPAQPMTGEDGEGGIEITVRIINEGRGPTRVLDLTPVDAQQLIKPSDDEGR